MSAVKESSRIPGGGHGEMVRVGSGIPEVGRRGTWEPSTVGPAPSGCAVAVHRRRACSFPASTASENIHSPAAGRYSSAA
ncbi:MAG: hypothetical protein C4529_10250 [Deltaproteobacteria bacterium]|nr:MAG: hypothetical protein C4529_10250 [Deltaproteobacteria bacterium]